MTDPRGHAPKEAVPVHETPTAAGEVPPPTLMAESETVAERRDGASGSDLPFSKIRCILLVATLAGAGLLNVSIAIVPKPKLRCSAAKCCSFYLVDAICPNGGHYPAEDRRRSRYPGESPTMGRLCLLVGLCLLSPGLGQDSRSCGQAADIRDWERLCGRHHDHQPFLEQ